MWGVASSAGHKKQGKPTADSSIHGDFIFLLRPGGSSKSFQNRNAAHVLFSRIVRQSVKLTCVSITRLLDRTESTMKDGSVKHWPRILLRVEGACIFGSTLWAYSRLNRSWWTFAGLLILPDLGFAAYLANTSIGAAVYNSTHTETPPILLLCSALARGNETIIGLALSWLAHIGMDRMLGYGLKYGTGFGHTHLGNLGLFNAPAGKKASSP